MPLIEEDHYLLFAPEERQEIIASSPDQIKSLLILLAGIGLTYWGEQYHYHDVPGELGRFGLVMRLGGLFLMLIAANRFGISSVIDKYFTNPDTSYFEESEENSEST